MSVCDDERGPIEGGGASQISGYGKHVQLILVGALRAVPDLVWWRGDGAKVKTSKSNESWVLAIPSQFQGGAGMKKNDLGSIFLVTPSLVGLTD